MSSVFKIYSPEDCDFYYDGELQGHIDGNSDRAFRFEVERKGAYRLKFVNSKYKSVLIVKVSIDADEEREVELDFSEVNEPVIRKIITAIEHDNDTEEGLAKEIISAIQKNGIVTIPDGVTKIGRYAFYGCPSLSSIIIPDSVTEIGRCAFYACHSLTTVTIPNSVTKIGHSAFYACISLTSITIPNGVKEIEGGAFSLCSGLTTITIANGLTAIGVGVFSICSSLTSIIIPDSITAIGSMAFSQCSNLKSITIPNSVREIGDDAFWDCSSLTSVYCKATTPPQIDPTCDPFEDTASDLKIYVPKSEGSTVLASYKSASGWRKYKDDIYEYDNE